MTKIILDTNVLIYGAKKGIDLREAIKNLDIPKPRIIIPDVVISELEKLKETAKKGSDKEAAKLALSIIEKSRLKIQKMGEGHVDYLIGSWAQKNGASVVTNDASFTIKLKELGVPTYSLRQKKYLFRRYT